MTACMQALLKDRRHRLALLAGKLEGLSPLKRLENGYAYLEGPGQENLRSVEQAKPGMTFSAYLQDGRIRAQVSEVIRNGK